MTSEHPTNDRELIVDEIGDQRGGSGIDRLALRRRSVLSLLGFAGVAGCTGFDPFDDDGPDDARLTEDSGDQSDHLPKELEMLIIQHIQAIADTSYTLDIEYQGENTPPDAKKRVQYKNSRDEGLVRLQESSTLDDGIYEVVHFVSDLDHTVTIEFEDFDPQAIADFSEEFYYFFNITGEALFRTFLAGTIQIEPVEGEYFDRDAPTSGAFKITDHSSYDEIAGYIEADDQGVITWFKMEWTDAAGDPHWIEIATSDIGETTIGLGDT